jgi:hypothetical protein
MCTTNRKPCSKHAISAGFPSAIAALLACLWLALVLAGTTAHAAKPSDTAGIVGVAYADATLEPDGLPVEQRRVTLPFRWDHEFPGRGGRATYRIDLPPSAVPRDEPAALLMSGVGSQVTVSFNDALVASYGTLGDPGHDASKSNLLVPVAAALRREGQAQSLIVRTTIQRQRGAGLGNVQYGTEGALSALYRSQQNWRNTSAIVYAVSLLLMGGLAGGLWLRQRDALYGCFALAALSGVARNLDRVWPDVPVSWPLWGAVVAVCYACHIGLIARFVLLVLERNPPWLVRSIHAALALSVALACASFAFARPLLWTAGLVILQLTSIVCLPYVVHGALIARRRIAAVLMAAGTMAILAGAHDLLLVRMGLFGGADYTLTPHAMFFFVMILAGLVVERYSRTVDDYSALNANLAARVAEREDQLRAAFETMRQQQQTQAVLLERQRIMREIHDGVGSQLVGLLNVVTQTTPDRVVVDAHGRRFAATHARRPAHGAGHAALPPAAAAGRRRHRAGVGRRGDARARPVRRTGGAAAAAHPARGLHQCAEACAGHAHRDARQLARRSHPAAGAHRAHGQRARTARGAWRRTPRGPRHRQHALARAIDRRAVAHRDRKRCGRRHAPAAGLALRPALSAAAAKDRLSAARTPALPHRAPAGRGPR